MKTKVIILHNDFDEGIEDYDLVIFENEVEYNEVEKVVSDFQEKTRFGYNEEPQDEYCWDTLIELLTKKFGKLITKNLKSNNITITW
mgnify:CR=1 FL=1